MLHEIFEFLKSIEKDCAIAGAAAMACHGYVRNTEDIDYAVVTANPEALFKQVADWLPPEMTINIEL